MDTEVLRGSWESGNVGAERHRQADSAASLSVLLLCVPRNGACEQTEWRQVRA